MKTFFVFQLPLFAALCMLLSTESCAPEPPPPPDNADLVGTWVSDYFEHEGLNVTNYYQMTLVFDQQGNSMQTLKKPGNITLSATLPYSMSADGKTLTIGSAVIAIEKFDLGYELILVYQSGQQPAGFVQPWRTVMKLQ